MGWGPVRGRPPVLARAAIAKYYRLRGLDPRLEARSPRSRARFWQEPASWSEAFPLCPHMLGRELCGVPLTEHGSHHEPQFHPL